MEISMFVPELALTKEGEQYTLTAVTPTPTSCYKAGSVELGVPTGGSVNKSTQGIILNLAAEGSVCLEVVTFVTQKITFKLGGGNSTIKTFVVLNGSVVGSRSIRIDEEHTAFTMGGGGEIPIPFIYLA